MATVVRLDASAVKSLLESEHGDVGRDLAKRALRVEALAKRLAPVDTGRLRTSISHDLAHDSQGLYAIVGTNVHYAIHQEFGTRYQHGQPFLRPALRAAR